MRCRKCDQELAEHVNVCPICKAVQTEETVQIEEAIQIQEETMRPEDMIEKVQQNQEQPDYGIDSPKAYPYPPRSKVLAGLLQIFFGGFGIGRLYLGYRTIAIAQLFTMPLFFIGSIWGVIDGILILCGQVPYDINGVPLK